MGNIESTRRDLEALDAADKLEQVLTEEFQRIKGANPVKLLAEAGKMLATGQFNSGKLGFSMQTLDQFELFLKLSRISRQKHREYVQDEINTLLAAEQIEVVNE